VAKREEGEREEEEREGDRSHQEVRKRRDDERRRAGGKYPGVEEADRLLAVEDKVVLLGERRVGERPRESLVEEEEEEVEFYEGVVTRRPRYRL